MLAGRLLVAAPPLHDPNFFRTVVLLLDHDEHGALGLVLNRPGDLAACEVVPRLAALLDDSAILYVGGPVQQDGVIGLAEYRDPATFGAQPVVGPVGVLDADLDADELAEGIARVRAFQGYAGWGPGSSSPSSPRRRGSSLPRTLRTRSTRSRRRSGGGPSSASEAAT